MLQGLKIEINAHGVGEILPDTVVGIGCSHQNALVNLVTSKGSDATYPDKGTALLSSGLHGSIFDQQSAQHAANFAALDTVSFYRRHGYAEHADINLSELRLALIRIESQYLRFRAQLSFANGEAISAIHNII